MSIGASVGVLSVGWLIIVCALCGWRYYPTSEAKPTYLALILVGAIFVLSGASNLLASHP